MKMVKKFAGMLMIVFLVTAGMCGCDNIKGDGNEVETIDVENEIENVSVTIGDVPLEFDLSKCNAVYELHKATSEMEVAVKVSGAESYDVYVNNSLLAGGSGVHKLERLATDSYLDIMFVDKTTGEEIHQYVQTYPSSAPKFYVKAKDEIDGYYYYTVSNYIFKMDSLGNIVFFWNIGAPCLDFKRTDTADGAYYSFFKANYTDYAIAADYVPATAIILDDSYTVVDTVDFLCMSDVVDYKCVLDSHELLVLGENHYIIQGYCGKIVNNIPEEVPHSNIETRIVAAVIQEIKDDELVWEWSSTEYPELYRMNLVIPDYYNTTKEWTDYVHLNSIEVDPRDNNYIVSLRNSCAVIKIDRETGEILWILGGNVDQFGLTESQKTSVQHFARVTGEGTITVFDNGALYKDGVFDLTKGQTRVIEYTLDEENKKLLDYKEYKVDNQLSHIMGSAQKIGDEQFVIGWGGRATANTLLSEIDFATGESLFFVVYPHTDFWSDSYRVFKSEK